MGPRRKAREAALQMLFEWEVSRGDPADVERRHWASARGRADRAFAGALFTGTVAALDEIDALIRDHAQHWRLERMAATDRNILRLAVHELRRFPETPRAVVINEALEIARAYSTPDSVQFINGVLDAIRRTLETGAPGPGDERGG
jgi:N utilization substance protein B